jgi:hypothetical protein
MIFILKIIVLYIKNAKKWIKTNDFSPFFKGRFLFYWCQSWVKLGENKNDWCATATMPLPLPLPPPSHCHNCHCHNHP